MIRLFSLLALGIIVLVGGTSIAGAQSMPDLKGTWTGTSSSIVSGLPPHHPTTLTAKPAGPNRLTEVKFTIKVDGQDGGRIWGTLTSPASAEPFIGVVSADGKRLRIVLQRAGVIEGTVLTPDSIEIMYVENANGVAVAATNLWTRQK
jgi:hypothetical protein